MSKTNKSIIISLMAVVCIIALVCALTQTTQNEANNSVNADTVLFTDFDVVDGYLYGSDNKIITSDEGGKYVLGTDGKYHLNYASVATKYDSSYSVVKIETGADLLTFIDSCSTTATEKNVGFVVNDIDYNMQELYSTSRSGKWLNNGTFYGILDGNGYTINMTSPVGGSEFYLNDGYSGIAGELSYNKTYYAVLGDRYYYGYGYAGMITGVNQGTITNCNFVWNSKLNVYSELSTSKGTLVYYGSKDWGIKIQTMVVGLVCGLLYNGTIENCTVDIEGGFAIDHKDEQNDNGGYAAPGMCHNSGIVGGVVGFVGSNGLLTRTTLTNEGGILCLSDGSMDSSATKKALAVAGGLAGGIKPADDSARITNCSLKGSGVVRANIAHDTGSKRNNDGGYGFSGGAVGATMIINAVDGYSTEAIKAGQIDGIISAWTGSSARFRFNSLSEAVSSEKSIAGGLFDNIGSSPEVKNVVILYDYIGLVQSQSNDNGKTYTTLDTCGDNTTGSIAYGSWTEIYKTTTYGTLNVMYDYSRTEDPIRVEAISEGFFDGDNYTGTGSIDDEITSTSKNFSLDDTKTGLGKFIWSVQYASNERGVADGTVIKASDKVGAQIFKLSGNRKGAVIYTFGEKVEASFQDTNTVVNTSNFITNNAKYYNGATINAPKLVLTRNTGEEVVLNSDAYIMTTKLTLLDDNKEETAYTYSITDQADTYIPGLYTYSIKINVTERDGTTATDFIYYDDTACVLAEYDENFIYQYAIYQGTSSMFTATNLSSADNWASSDTITLSYLNKAGVMQYYTYKKGNGTESIYNAVDEASANVTLTVNESGKFTYNFNAYIENPLYVEDSGAPEFLKIGTTSAQCFVDNAAPIIKSVKYYEYDESAVDHKGPSLSTSDLNEWLTTDVLITYEVNDSSMSGIDSGSGHTNFNEVTASKWSCSLKLDGKNSSQTIYYTDKAGNTVEKTFSVRIDTTKTELTNVFALNYSEYLVYYATMEYCPDSVKINFIPVFGASGAYLQYSYEQDENNEDIWINYEKEIKSNQANTFILDFEITNATFKMRLVSTEGIYATSYANGNGYVTNGASDYEESIRWTINVVIAYMSITLDNIYYGDKALSSMTSDDLGSLFSKNYDAKDVADISLTVKVYKDGTNDELNSTTTILYSDKYSIASPDILTDYTKVTAVYSSANAGSRQISISVEGTDAYEGKYLFFFTDGREFTDFTILLKESKVYDQITTTISPSTINVAMASYTDQLKSSYVYGTEIPTTIKVDGEAGDVVTLKVVSDAQCTYENGKIVAYPNVGTYTVSADFIKDEGNYVLNVTSSDLVITQKPVSVLTTLDGVKGYSPTLTYDGVSHKIEGTYTDVFGETQNATIKYYFDTECNNLASEDVISVINVYYVKLTIDDENYSVSNSKNPITFSIVKGYLSLDLTAQTYEYSGYNIPFELKSTSGVEIKSDDTFDPAVDVCKMGDFTISYYLVVNNVPSSTKLEEIYAVGKYLVQIEIKDNDYFYDQSYADTYIEITKAKTSMSIDDVTITYDGKSHTYDYTLGNVLVSSVSSKSTVVGLYDNVAQYYTYNNGVISRSSDLTDILQIQVFDEVTRKYVTVNELSPANFTDAGTYIFKVSFLGDNNFDASSKQVNLIIEEASMEGITFEDVKTYYGGADNYYPFIIDDSENSVLKKYLDMGAELIYRYNAEDYKYGTEAYTGTYTTDESGKEVLDQKGYLQLFSEVNTYTVLAIVTLENYKTLQLAATLTIDKTKIEGIMPVEVNNVEYDGAFHPGEFTGFDLDDNGNMKVSYLSGYESSKIIEKVWYKGVAVDVEYDDEACPYTAGTHFGEITFTSTEYATETIQVKVVISQKKVTEIDFSWLSSMINKINSSTDLSNLYAEYDKNGDTDYVSFEYYNESGEKVELDEDGCLPAGDYTIKMVFADANFCSDVTATITIAQASNNGSTTTTNKGGDSSGDSSGGIVDLIKNNIILIAAAAGGIVVVIVGIVVGVSVSKKKKKAKTKARAKAKAKAKTKKKASNDGKATF